MIGHFFTLNQGNKKAKRLSVKNIFGGDYLFLMRHGRNGLMMGEAERVGGFFWQSGSESKTITFHF
jgi:hypothetical protein